MAAVFVCVLFTGLSSEGWRRYRDHRTVGSPGSGHHHPPCTGIGHTSHTLYTQSTHLQLIVTGIIYDIVGMLLLKDTVQNVHILRRW